MTRLPQLHDDEEILEEFLDLCRGAARRAGAAFPPAGGGVGPDYALEANPRCRSILDGHAPEVRVLTAVRARGRCSFRVPLAGAPVGAVIAPDGDDVELRLPAQQRGEGVCLGRGTLGDGEALLRELLLPDGLEHFLGEHVMVTRGWSGLRTRFDYSELAIEWRKDQAGWALWCTFQAEMDAWRS